MDTQLDLMMSTISYGHNEELSAIKQELSAESEAANEELMKKIKFKKPLVFRKKGHEKQYIHNEEGRMMLSDAHSVLSEAPQAMQYAKTLFEQGEKLTAERQKQQIHTVGPITGGLC